MVNFLLGLALMGVFFLFIILFILWARKSAENLKNKGKAGRSEIKTVISKLPKGY